MTLQEPHFTFDPTDMRTTAKKTVKSGSSIGLKPLPFLRLFLENVVKKCQNADGYGRNNFSLTLNKEAVPETRQIKAPKLRI